MSNTVLAILIRPLALLVLFVVLVLPLKFAFMRWFPEGRVKRYLLR